MSKYVTFVLVIVIPIAVTEYEPTNGFDGPSGPPRASLIQTVTKLANTDEDRFAKTLKTMQNKTTDSLTGYLVNKRFSKRFTVPFLALCLSLILTGGISYFLQFDFENDKPLDKSHTI